MLQVSAKALKASARSFPETAGNGCLTEKISSKIVGVIEASLSIQGFYAHAKTMKAIAALVNVDLIENYKNQ
jgi:hypothetical protein